jgi:membrane fusion protein, multidrug efflux system
VSTVSFRNKFTARRAVRRSVAPVVAAIGIGLVTAGTGVPITAGQTPAPRSASTQAAAVPVIAVVAKPVERTIALPGDLVAFQDVVIHARVQGFIDEIRVDRGSQVRRGAVIATIVAPELQAQLREAEANVEAAQAALAEAEAAMVSEQATFARLQKAAQTPGVVAGNDVQIAEQKVVGGKARVAAAMRHVEALRQGARSLRDVEAYLQVTAPFDGVVTERTAHVGTLVGPGGEPIVRLQQVSRLRLVAAIPETYVASAPSGQPVPFTVAAFPGQKFAGTLARVARALDTKTRTMAAELDVANSGGQLAPGMFAEVQWPVKRAGTSLLVPRTAVATTTERTFVVRVRDGKAEWVDVRRGAVIETQVEVLGNLKAGDEIAVRGTDELREGTPVRPVKPAAK